MPTYNDLTLTTGSGGSIPFYLAVDEVNGKAFVLYNNFLDISAVDLTVATPGETELAHATIAFTGGETINSNLFGAPPYVAGTDGFVYALGQNTFNDGSFTGNQRIYKIDPSTFSIVGSVAIPFTAGNAGTGLSAASVGGHPYITILYFDNSNNSQVVVIDGSLITTLGGTAGVVGTANLGNGSPSFATLLSFLLWDSSGNIYSIHSSSGTNDSYISQVTGPGYTTFTTYTIPRDSNNQFIFDGLYDSGTNSLLLFLFDTASFGSTGEISQWDITTHSFTGVNAGVPPASPVYDANNTPDSSIVLGNLFGQRGHTNGGKFFLTDPNDDLDTGFNPSGDIFNQWTASSLTQGTQFNVSAGWTTQTVWQSPLNGQVSNAFYSHSGTDKFMLVPRGTSVGALAPHFYIASLSSTPPPPPSTGAPVFFLID